jgi:phosphohistidine swiveling domain-containing protein
MTPLVLPLAHAVDINAAGGKAHTLAHLIALGVRVPDGVVIICAALDKFLEESGLRARLLRLQGGNDGRGDDRLAPDAIRSLLLAAPVSQVLAEQVRAAIAPLGRGPFAVRSSAVGEDGSDASFAGQFDSILHVHDDALMDAVRACWASCWSERALAYRRVHGFDAAAMAVVVQRQVDAAVAGVLFTRNPDPSSPNAPDMVIEYCSGLADRLVAGEVDPGRLYLSRANLTVTDDAHTAEHAGARQALSPRLLNELGATALRLEEAFGAPQDIEWTVSAEGQLAFVQARPITTRTDTAQATVLWSNANVSENFPEPVSPLLYSIASAGYYHYFRNLGRAFGVSRHRLTVMDGQLRTIIGVHGARIYYNLTNIHAVLRMAPFGERLAEAFNVFVGVRRVAEQPAGTRTWKDARHRVLAALEVLRIAAAVAWQFVFLPRRLRTFERTADEFAAQTTREALNGRSLPELGARLAAFIDIRCNRWKNASLCDTAAMVCYALLRSLLARGGFHESAHTRLLRALPGVPSSQPALRLWALSRRIVEDPALRALFDTQKASTVLASLGTPEGVPYESASVGHPFKGAEDAERFASFRAGLQDFLTTWGFRSSGELMLTTATLEEEPEPVIALLQQYAGAGGESPEEAIVRMAAQRAEETRVVVRSLARRRPWLIPPTLLVLRWTQAAVACRERARLKQALLYTRCRRVALAIGDELVRAGRLSDRNAIFMLSWQEIDEICGGRAMFPRDLASLVALRTKAHAAESATTPPDTFYLAPAGIFSPGAYRQPDRAVRVTADSAGAITLQGTTACGGQVSSRAAVLAGVHDAHLLQRGDVLVTRQTDPGWAPVFCLVSGLVIERGGMLSHGAIIAREFGLPCIVGVANATGAIPHGARVTINADDGICRIEAAA